MWCSYNLCFVHQSSGCARYSRHSQCLRPLSVLRLIIYRDLFVQFPTHRPNIIFMCSTIIRDVSTELQRGRSSPKQDKTVLNFSRSGVTKWTIFNQGDLRYLHLIHLHMGPPSSLMIIGLKYTSCNTASCFESV